MKRLLAMLICLALVLSVLPQCWMVNAEALSDEEILKQRRDTVYNTMMDMATVMWRATEDINYLFATSAVTIKKGRLYRGIPYTHARGNYNTFEALLGEPNEKGEREISGLTAEMLDGGPRDARIGMDCSGAVCAAYATVSSTIKNVGASTVTVNKGFVPVGIYTPNPASNSNGVQICIDNGEQVMYQSYAMAQYADIVSCSSHSMMTQSVNVVYAEDGTIDGELSTMTVVHQAPDLVRDNRVYTEGPYSEAEYGEKVYRTFRIDEAKSFKTLFDSGYLPYTCKELIDPSAVAEAVVTDSETEHSYKNILSGVISANRMIESVTMTITDANGEVLQQGTAYTYRADYHNTNTNMNYDLGQILIENPSKMTGQINLNWLGVGDYHCRLDVKLMSGETVEKVRDFDFSVAQEDLGAGWVDNSALEFTEVEGKKMAVCPVCKGDPVEWKVLPTITTATSLAAGHYYLDADRTQTGRFSVAGSATTCVHLNDHNITCTNSQVFRLGAANGVLNIMGIGNVKGSYNTERDGYKESATIYISSGSASANLYGGNYGHTYKTERATLTTEAANPRITMYTGATVCRMDGANGPNVEMRNGHFDMRGGRILDGKNKDGYGGNVRIYMSSTFGTNTIFTQYGGIIAEGRAKYGANVYVYGHSNTNPRRKFIMHEGAVVTAGFAGYASSSTGLGGNVYVTNYGFAQLDGTISYGKAYSGGGNVYTRSGADITIGGTVAYGNGDYAEKGNLSGGNVYLLDTGTTAIITGTVRDPLTATSVGGNIFCSAASVTVDGGTVSGGRATSRGGNIYLPGESPSLLVKNNGKIINGTAPNGGNVSTNSATAVITVESGSITGGTATNDGDDLRLYEAATVNLSGGAVGDVYGHSGTFNLSGNANIGRLAFESGTVKLDNGWTGSADVTWGGSYVTDGVLTNAACGSTTDGTFTAGDSFDGNLVYNSEQPALGVDGVVRLAAAGVASTAGEKGYLSVDEALAAVGEGNTLKLYTDAELTLEKDTYVDINGNNVTVSGSGKLYGIDSSNDDYLGNGTATVTGDVERITTDPATGNRYVAIEDNGTATFHRVALKPSAVTLRPTDAGLYYKARYNCDETLAKQVKCYGVVLSLYNMPGEDFMAEFWDNNRYTVASEPFKPGAEATSGAVFNIMRTGNKPEINVRNGEMTIYANAYLLLNDDTLVMADQTVSDTVNDPGFDGAAYSLYDVMKTLDEKWADYENKHDQILEFYNTWAQHGMSSWQFENIK